MNANKTEDGLRPHRGILDQIFAKEDLVRMERLHRIARCRAILAEMPPVDSAPELAGSLAMLRQLLRAEYGAALADYIHGSCAPTTLPRSSTAAPAPVKVISFAGKLRSIVAAIKGGTPWTR